MKLGLCLERQAICCHTKSGSAGPCAEASVFDHFYYSKGLHYCLASRDIRTDLVIYLRNEAFSSMLALSFGNYIKLYSRLNFLKH